MKKHLIVSGIVFVLLIVVLGGCISNQTDINDLVLNPVKYLGKKITVRGNIMLDFQPIIGYNLNKSLVSDIDSSFITIVITDDVSIPKIYPMGNYLITGIYTYVDDDEYGEFPLSFITTCGVYYLKVSSIVADD